MQFKGIEYNLYLFQVKGQPTPDVKWFLKGKELEASNFVVMGTDGDYVTLTLKGVSMENTGEVTCQVVVL